VALFFLFWRLGPPLFLLSVAALSALGVWASDHAERHFGRHDDGRIVVDEVAGQLVSLAPLLWLEHEAALAPRLIPGIAFWVVTGFVLFRVFDIWKPGPVRWAERRFEGGAGVMADDLIAGLCAALLLAALLLVLPKAPGLGAMS